VRIGRFELAAGFKGDVEALAAEARRTAFEGFPSFWQPNTPYGTDALSVCAALGREALGLELGIAVVPIHSRHPVALAQQALTANALAGGRITLGIGVSHRMVVEDVYGASYDGPAGQMRSYLEALVPLLEGNGEITVAPSGPARVLVAALGPRMLDVAGSLADGTVTWMTGARTLADHTVPRLRDAAAASNRPEPRVVAGVPMCVTGDVTGARARADRQFAAYGRLPAYRAMLDREGAATPADAAIVGGEEWAAAAIAGYRDAGVTDLVVCEFGSAEEKARTTALLRQLLA
jgi:5,10-methylenetetrahydromethanopterin reductase